MKNRRAFLKTVIRGGIFASLAIAGGIFVRRWHQSDDCNRNFACGNCHLSDKCALPEADKYRLEKARGNPMNAENGRNGK